jgi:hypothetical protein
VALVLYTYLFLSVEDLVIARLGFLHNQPLLEVVDQVALSGVTVRISLSLSGLDAQWGVLLVEFFNETDNCVW